MTKKSQKKSSKGVTLDLNTFLTTPTHGETINWAEEMEGEEPTTTSTTTTASSGGLTLEELRASSTSDSSKGGYSKGGFGGYSARQESNLSRELGSTVSKVKPPSFFSEGAPQKSKTSQFESTPFREERRERKQHPQHDLPTEKPFVAFIGNLNYDVTKEDLQEFFGDCNPINVSIPRDKETHKIKGYGYVEFDTVEDLKAALQLNGGNVLERAIKIDIAAPETASKVSLSNRDNNFRQNREGGFRQHRQRDDFEERRQPPSIADKSDNWRSGGDELGDVNPFGNSKKPIRKPNQQENTSPFGSFNRKPREETRQERPVQEKPAKPSLFGEGKAWEPKEKDLQGPNLDIYTSKKPKERSEKKEHQEKKVGEDKESGFQTATSKPRGGRRYAQQGTRGGFTKKRGGANSSSRTNNDEAEGEPTESNNPYAALSEQTDE